MKTIRLETKEVVQFKGRMYRFNRKVHFKNKYYFLFASRGDTGCVMVIDDDGKAYEITYYFNGKYASHKKIIELDEARIEWYCTTNDCAMERYVSTEM